MADNPDLYEKYASAIYGKDNAWETSGEQCPKCEGYHVEYRVFDIGPDARYRYRCNDCDHAWWVESDQ